MTARQVAGAFWAALKRFDTRFGWSRSSNIALSTMLALFPFTIFALSLTRAISEDLATLDIVQFVYGTWPESIAEPIVNEVQAVLRDSSVKAMTIGGLLAVYFASNGVDAVREAFTAAYRDNDPRPFWKTRALSVLFVLGGAAILACAAILTFAVPIYVDTVYVDTEKGAESIRSYDALRRAVSYILLIFTVFACHMWLPVTHRHVKQVFPGVALTAVLWIAAGKGFALYVATFSSYSITYAGLAGVMAALVFMYIMAVIFVFGAEFNGRLIAARQEADTVEGG